MSLPLRSTQYCRRLTGRNNFDSSHLLRVLYDFDPFPSVFMRPLRPVAFVRPAIRRGHSGYHQLEHPVPPGDQSDASVRVAPGELGPRHHVSLRSEGQDLLRRGSVLQPPADGQVGGVAEDARDVTGKRDLTSFGHFWGRGLRGDAEGVGND